MGASHGPAKDSGTHGGDPKLKAILVGMAQAITSLATLSANQASAKYPQLEVFKEFGRGLTDFRKNLKPKRPKLSAKDPNSLHHELKVLRLYFNNMRIHDKAHWWTGARMIATDRAHIIIESLIISKFGSEERYQAALQCEGATP